MAPRKSLSPLLPLLLAAAASFGLLHHLAACHALHRQSPLTMSTAFPPSNSSNGDGTAWANSDSQGQCVDLLEKEGEAAIAAVSSSRRLGSSGEDPLYKRGEAQRCLLPSHASLMRQQQQLGPDAGNFPCASKYLMTAAPPPATLQKQRQRRDSQQLPRPSQLELRQQLLQQQLQQKRPEREQKHGRHETHLEAPSNIAFNWRDSSNPPSAVPDSPQDVRRFHVAAAISADSASAVGQREKAAADASNHTAAASGEGKQQKKSFLEALGQAAAAEAAALVGGTWDWSTWGIGGVGQSGLPAAASAKQTAAAASSSAAEVVKGAAADGGPGGASALGAANTAVGTATSLAGAPAAAAVARKSAETSTSGLAGTEGGAAAAVVPSSAVPLSAGGPAQSPAAAGEQQHRPAAEAEADRKSDSSKSKESSWWGGQTWTDAIGSFFQKLDQRIEDAQGMLSHSDLYEFPL